MKLSSSFDWREARQVSEEITRLIRMVRERSQELETSLEVNDATRKDYQARIATLEAKLDKYRAIIKSLAGECYGMMKSHEYAIRADFGNSNWECFQLRLKEAIELCAEPQEDLR